MLEWRSEVVDIQASLTIMPNICPYLFSLNCIVPGYQFIDPQLKFTHLYLHSLLNTFNSKNHRNLFCYVLFIGLSQFQQPLFTNLETAFVKEVTFIES